MGSAKSRQRTAEDYSFSGLLQEGLSQPKGILENFEDFKRRWVHFNAYGKNLSKCAILMYYRKMTT